MSRILPLSPDAISKIHSSKIITTLQGVVLALLENSLDAGASKVDIEVDFRRGACVVEDNGCGIEPSEFQQDGGLGKMYHTSKQSTRSDHGFHSNTGTYLASLGALSLLQISSQHAGRDEQASLTIHQGKVISWTGPNQEASSMLQPGTCVTVRDLFGNMPVRLKQRALAVDVGMDDERSWHELKRGIVALLLAWPKPCSVGLHETESRRAKLNFSGVHPKVSTALTEKSLNRLAGQDLKFDLRDALPIVFQAGLAPLESRSNWIPVSASTPEMSIKGAVCLDPAPSKQCQFLAVGIHPCYPTAGRNDMYDAINKIFTNSSFGCVQDESDVDEAEKDRRKRDRRYKTESYNQKRLHGRKGIDRWPMFVLQVKFQGAKNNGQSAENFSERSLSAIIEVLEAAVSQWLVANHFRPRKRRVRKNQDQQSPAASSTFSSRDSSPRSAAPRTLVSDSPSLKRGSLRIENATTSKRRKYVDVAGRIRLLEGSDEDASSHTANSFSTISHIKSGRSAFYDELWEVRKPATAPAGQSGCGPERATIPSSRRAFNLPAVNAGELNGIRTQSRRLLFTALGTEAIASKDLEVQEASSEDFGSHDDEEMLALAEPRDASMEQEASFAMTGTDSYLGEDGILDWLDPVTKQVFKVNSRTGVVLPLRRKDQEDTPNSMTAETGPTRSSAAINTSLSSTGKPLSISHRPKSAVSRESGWLPGFLKEWKNPVFAQPDEERIPIASFNGPGIDLEEAAAQRCTHDHRTEAFAESGGFGTSKLSKTMLKHGKIIKQVDKKFILCKVPSTDDENDPGMLILVDQHAASERVILEDLLAELCSAPEPTANSLKSGVKTVGIEKPLRFQITATEYQLFEEHKQRFANWGILYDLSETNESLTASQVRAPKLEHKITVRSLAPGIAERCNLVPKLLIELLRSEIWTLSESGHRPPDLARADSDDNTSWLHRIGSCPKGILDMLNSRACRSAIMFNDQLSIAECEELLAKLSQCAFPFMCAHGRVSMVPLVRIGNEGDWSSNQGLFGENAKPSESFADAFTRWKDTDRQHANENSS